MFFSQPVCRTSVSLSHLFPLHALPSQGTATKREECLIHNSYLIFVNDYYLVHENKLSALHEMKRLLFKTFSWEHHVLPVCTGNSTMYYRLILTITQRICSERLTLTDLTNYLMINHWQYWGTEWLTLLLLLVNHECQLVIKSFWYSDTTNSFSYQ